MKPRLIQGECQLLTSRKNKDRDLKVYSNTPSPIRTHISLHRIQLQKHQNNLYQ